MRESVLTPNYIHIHVHARVYVQTADNHDIISVRVYDVDDNLADVNPEVKYILCASTIHNLNNFFRLQTGPPLSLMLRILNHLEVCFSHFLP